MANKNLNIKLNETGTIECDCGNRELEVNFYKHDGYQMIEVYCPDCNSFNQEELNKFLTN